jgi:hypothetical protein
LRDPEEIRIMTEFMNVGLREFAEALGNGDQHLAERWAMFAAATQRRISGSEQEQDAR